MVAPSLVDSLSWSQLARNAPQLLGVNNMRSGCGLRKSILGWRMASKFRSRRVEGAAQLLDSTFRREYDGTSWVRRKRATIAANLVQDHDLAIPRRLVGSLDSRERRGIAHRRSGPRPISR